MICLISEMLVDIIIQPYGGFLSHRGTPSYHLFIDWIFHETTHPAIGVPLPFQETPLYIYILLLLLLLLFIFIIIIIYIYYYYYYLYLFLLLLLLFLLLLLLLLYIYMVIYGDTPI